MLVETSSGATLAKNLTRNTKRRHRTSMPARYAATLLATLKSQLPTLLSIVISELLIHFEVGTKNYIVIILLCATVYTAYRKGIKQALISAAIVIIYCYYLIIRDTTGPWLTLDTFRRGLVLLIAFPIIGAAIGWLKERNDRLLLSEQTARKKAEASERELRFMAESMPQKIFTANPSGKIIYRNPQWAEYGRNPDMKDPEANWQAIIHPNDLKENELLWKRSIETGEPFQFEHRLKRNDGTYVWHISRAHALRDTNGAIIMWVGSSTDIEDVRKRRKLEANTARLMRQQKELMELNVAKDEFISLASHQLRTPATGVKQYIGMVIDGFAGEISPTVRTLLQKAASSNERQLSVINDLLRVAQVDAGKVTVHTAPVNATQLIDDVLHEQSSKFTDRDQTVTFIKPKQSLRIAADATKIRMVIENLVDNASKYTPEGKRITVRMARAGKMAKISVIDEGVGIPKEDVDKVFEKFLRLENPMSTAVGGTGIGLYWVKRVVELHGGDISVTSTLNKGSTFTITLPLA